MSFLSYEKLQRPDNREGDRLSYSSLDRCIYLIDFFVHNSWLNSLFNPASWVGFILLFLCFCSNARPFCSSTRHLPLKRSSKCCSGHIHFQRDQKKKRKHVNASQVTGTAVDVTVSQWVPEDAIIQSDTDSALQATSVTAQVKHTASSGGGGDTAANKSV